MVTRQGNNPHQYSFTYFLFFFTIIMVFIGFLTRLIRLYPRFAKEGLGLPRMCVGGVLECSACH